MVIFALQQTNKFDATAEQIAKLIFSLKMFIPKKVSNFVALQGNILCSINS